MKNLQELEKIAACVEKIAQAPEWLQNYMADEYPAQGVGRPALEGGQVMHVAPDVSNLQGIASFVGAKTLVEFLAAHENDPAKAKSLAPAAKAELSQVWPQIVADKGEGKAGVIADAFNKLFAQYGLGNALASKTDKLSKLADKLQSKYLQK